jgi:DNA replicative helicase MCM subunit Mcm2 (Cdc46/Mcm family)
MAQAGIDVRDGKRSNIDPSSFRFGNFFMNLFPLNRSDSEKLSTVAEWFSVPEIKEIKYLLKTKRISFYEASLGVSDALLEDSGFLLFAANSMDRRVHAKVDFYNRQMVSQGKNSLFDSFAKDAEKRILDFIAPGIIGRDDIKLAALLQLFAKEKVHLLLLGDPATGKTVILRSIADIAPISSFGLGSGTSKAGLTLAVSGKDVIKGLLPMADDGIACIDELNLMKSQDLAGLLNAMEKGFITYDKANSHIKVDARVKVFASANPAGDKFIGKSISLLKKQIPFDDALLSRFHLLFLIRRPDKKEFMQISEKILHGGKEHTPRKEDVGFIKEFVHYSLQNEVGFDQKLSPMIQSFVNELKNDEGQFMVEVSPRTVIGMINLAKASARMRHSDKVTESDIEKVIGVFRSALYIKKSELEK